ncbi:ABC transporter ATP-binding protein [Zophobihabitans entericus]|uniref:ABC transporter ATP-binding protein n=1 Tax=Zophobihabitans entericus TaxID=1635327 RepID=A0A6G9IAD1_9GAMM|nr:ABC transporter ATP-binding protein [Zophobihabitans entericus]QIQ21176.1 ABC transporter ATP-binding protein [Zophobihabitans entericus]
MTKGLTVSHLTTGYGHKNIITDLNLSTLPKNKVVALLGPNGSGKSTLLRALAGLNKATGKIVYDGLDFMQCPFVERARRVVYLPQSLPAGVHLRVLESVIVAQRASNFQATDENAILDVLARLGITHLTLSYLDELSGGQKQLVGLAQSLIRKPDILLLDEPLSALDLNYQFHVMDMVKKETVQRDMVTVIVVHDINIALRHADYIVMLKHGGLIAEGIPCEVITPENLATVYGVQGRIEYCSRGYPQVLVDGLI